MPLPSSVSLPGLVSSGWAGLGVAGFDFVAFLAFWGFSCWAAAGFGCLAVVDLRGLAADVCSSSWSAASGSGEVAAAFVDSS